MDRMAAKRSADVSVSTGGRRFVLNVLYRSP
jgi:hypothetical protein